jgi:predicted small secreted protein
MMNRKVVVTSASIVAAALLAGCTSTEQGAGYGTLGGAAIGGAVGGWQGAAIGAGAGALTGALVGNAVDSSEERRAQTYAAPPPPPPPPASYPAGLLTDRPGFVKSPYNPNGPLVDVRGFAPGTLVRDPVTNRNFIVP